jgi:hypothetical protein
MVEDQQGLEATTVHRLLGYRRMDDSDDEEEEVQQQGTTQKQGSATPAPASGLDGQGSGADAQSSLTGSTPPPEVQGTAGTAEGTTSGTSTSAGTSTSTTSSSTVTNVDLLDDSLFTFNHRRKLQADAGKSCNRACCHTRVSRPDVAHGDHCMAAHQAPGAKSPCNNLS